MDNQFKFLFILILSLWGCSQSSEKSEKEVTPRTSASVCKISVEPIQITEEYPATSAFQKKSSVKALVTGYIKEVFFKPGDAIEKGKLIFTIRTKESSAISKANTDSMLHFSGNIKVFAPISGEITSLTRQSGEYVTEGDELTTIAAPSSIIFLAEIPVENLNPIKTGTKSEILLPDGRKLNATVGQMLSSVEPGTQTRRYIIKTNVPETLPENMNCKLIVKKKVKDKAIVLPKSALLCDETQRVFWVMKLINDSVAVRVLVKQGLIQKEKVEILEPQFSEHDRFLDSGNYGLEDTVLVNIIHKP